MHEQPYRYGGNTQNDWSDPHDYHFNIMGWAKLFYLVHYFHLNEDAIKRKEGVLRVTDLHKKVKEWGHLRGPLQIEPSDQWNYLEVVRQYSNQNSLRLVPLWILKQITIIKQLDSSYNRLLEDIWDPESSDSESKKQ